MYVLQFNYHTSFLYLFPFGTEKSPPSGPTLHSKKRLETRLLLSLVSTGPYFRPETSKLSVTVGKDL